MRENRPPHRLRKVRHGVHLFDAYEDGGGAGGDCEHFRRDGEPHKQNGFRHVRGISAPDHQTIYALDDKTHCGVRGGGHNEGPRRARARQQALHHRARREREKEKQTFRSARDN